MFDESTIDLRIAELKNSQYLSIISLCLDLLTRIHIDTECLNEPNYQDLKNKIDFGLQESGTGWRLL